MNLKKSILLAITAFFFFTSNAQTKSHSGTQVYEDTTLSNEIEESSRYVPSSSCANPMTLNNCIRKLCDINSSKLGNYTIMVYESNQCYAVGIFPIDENGRIIEQRSKNAGSRIKYYILSKKEFNGLSYMNVVQKIRIQFDQFGKTKEFMHSPIAQVKTVSIKFAD